jgi:exodeoxyribonuclease VII small subunit
MAKNKSFEQDLRELEKVVEKLEGGSTSLDEAIRLFQKGKTLGRACEERLREVETKIQQLVEDEEGNLSTVDVDPPSEEKA